MPIGTVTLATPEINAYTARKELFISTNRVRFRVADPRWSSNGRWDVPAFIDDATTPARWVADGQADRFFRSSGASGLTTAYLLFDLTALNSRLGQIDALALCGQFSHLSGTILGFFEMSNAADFSGIIGPGGMDLTGIDGKVIRTILGTNNGYRDVRYARWRFTTSASSFGGEFRVSEAVMGTRVQLARSPRYPKPPLRYRQQASVRAFESYTGARQDIVKWRGREVLDLSFRLGNGIHLLDDAVEMQRFWTDTEQGTWPVIWCDEVSPTNHVIPPFDSTVNFSRGLLAKCDQDDFAIVRSGPETFTADLRLLELPNFRQIAGS